MTVVPSSGALSPAAARRVFYTLTFTRWFPIGFVVGLFILLQTSRGLSAAQALTATAAIGLVTFALELPTSGFADALGRRPVYLTAAVVGVLSAVAYAVAHTFWAFVAAAALTGVFRALDSGPLEAWFVDEVHAMTPGVDVDQELARAGTLLGLAMATGAGLSGLLVWWHPIKTSPAIDAAFWVFAALSVVHLVAAAMLMKETPRRESGAARREQVRESVREAPVVVRTGVRLLATNRVLLGIVLADVAWSIGMISFESFMPLRLGEMLGSTQEAGALMGVVAAVGWGVFGAGSHAAGLLSGRIGVARAAMVGRVLNGLGAMFIGLVASPVMLVAVYFLTYAAHALNGAPHGALLHREASASNRSTVLSMTSMMGFLAFGLGAPAAGWLADRTSLGTAAFVVGAVSLLGVFGYLPARRAERARGIPPASSGGIPAAPV